MAEIATEKEDCFYHIRPALSYRVQRAGFGPVVFAATLSLAPAKGFTVAPRFYREAGEN
jgi:hypothetical protein